MAHAQGGLADQAADVLDRAADCGCAQQRDLRRRVRDPDTLCCTTSRLAREPRAWCSRADEGTKNCALPLGGLAPRQSLSVKPSATKTHAGAAQRLPVSARSSSESTGAHAACRRHARGTLVSACYEGGSTAGLLCLSRQRTARQTCAGWQAARPSRTCAQRPRAGRWRSCACCWRARWLPWLPLLPPAGRVRSRWVCRLAGGT